MKNNMSSIDRLVRGVVGVVVVLLYFMDVVGGTWGVVLLILAAILILTSFVGFCPLYTIFGINTRSDDEKK